MGALGVCVHEQISEVYILVEIMKFDTLDIVLVLSHVGLIQ